MDNLSRVDSLNQLKALWNEAPSLRLGQLIVNAMAISQDYPNKTELAERLFEVSDQDLIKHVSDFIKARTVALQGRQ